jgi:hypothetical protein
MLPSLDPAAALVVAHPGHELRVHHWLELTRPFVIVLTDGSGHNGQSRLASTTRVLAAAGARPGPIYGRFTDAELYAAIRLGDAAGLLRFARELAAALSAGAIHTVVGDALEGFNPGHDLCRFLVNVAVSLIQRRTGRELENYDFLLDGSSEHHPHASDLRVELDEAALRRKLAAADRYPELKGEADAALARFGPREFRTETLRRVSDVRQGLAGMAQEPPDYERYGEMRVRAGYYDRVIRFRDDVLPLVRSLWRQAGLPTDEAARVAPPADPAQRP